MTININEIIKEEVGVSRFAEDLLKRMEDESLDIEFQKETSQKIMVSDGMIKMGGVLYDLDLYVVFVNVEPIKYPVSNAKLEIDTSNNKFEVFLYLHESFKSSGATTEDIFNNEAIKSALIHELHHLVRMGEMKKQKGFEAKFEKLNPFLCYIFDVFKVGNQGVQLKINKWGSPSPELVDFYYYLSKSELGSVIPQFKFDKNIEVKDMFKKIGRMSYPEFINYIQNNHNGRTPTKKEYNNVMKRVRYFFRKIRKLGVSE